MSEPTVKIRTHEPTLFELTAELDSLAMLMAQYCSHNAKLEEEREKRWDVTIAAMKNETALSFTWSEKAIGKAEANAEKWRDNSNEWRTAMNDREIKFATKSEVTAELATLQSEIANLNVRSSGNIGVQEGTKQGKEESRGSLLAVVIIMGTLISLIGAAVVIMNLMHLLKG
jgi:hypothetical protein